MYINIYAYIHVSNRYASSTYIYYILYRYIHSYEPGCSIAYKNCRIFLLRLIIRQVHDISYFYVSQSELIVYRYSKLSVNMIDNRDWPCVHTNDSPWQRSMNSKPVSYFVFGIDLQSWLTTSYFDWKRIRFL